MMRREDEKTSACRRVLPEEEEILQGNYYRGLDRQRSILQEHFMDHALERPPSFSSDQKFRPGNAQNERSKQNDH